jgi:hypothetical protein
MVSPLERTGVVLAQKVRQHKLEMVRYALLTLLRFFYAITYDSYLIPPGKQISVNSCVAMAEKSRYKHSI